GTAAMRAALGGLGRIARNGWSVAMGLKLSVSRSQDLRHGEAFHDFSRGNSRSAFPRLTACHSAGENPPYFSSLSSVRGYSRMGTSLPYKICDVETISFNASRGAAAPACAVSKYSFLNSYSTPRGTRLANLFGKSSIMRGAKVVKAPPACVKMNLTSGQRDNVPLRRRL